MLFRSRESIFRLRVFIITFLVSTPGKRKKQAVFEMQVITGLESSDGEPLSFPSQCRSRYALSYYLPHHYHFIPPHLEESLLIACNDKRVQSNTPASPVRRNDSFIYISSNIYRSRRPAFFIKHSNVRERWVLWYLT